MYRDAYIDFILHVEYYHNYEGKVYSLKTNIILFKFYFISTEFCLRA